MSPTTRASDCRPTLPSSPETASTGNSTWPLVPVASFSTRITSPGATRYCLPPARITAYIRLPPSKYRESQHPTEPSRTRAQLLGPQNFAVNFPRELPAELLLLAVFSAAALE